MIVKLFRNSVAAKIVTFQSVLVVVIVLVSVSVNYMLLQQYIADIQGEHLHSSAESVSLIVKNEFDDVSNHIESIANDPLIEKYLDTHNPKSLVNLFSRSSDLFQSISYVNETGVEEVKLVNGKTSENLLNIAKNKIFIHSETQANTLFAGVSEYHVETGLAVLEMSFRSVNYFDQYMAYIRVSLPLTHFQKKVKQIRVDNSVDTYIINDKGYILFAPENNMLLRKITDLGLSDIVENNNSYQGKLSKRQMLLGEFSVVASVVMPDLGWRVITTIPVSKLSEDLNNQKKILIIVTLLMILLGVLLSYRFSKKIVRPILLLNEITEEISQQGKIEERVAWTSNDDVGRLAFSFNRMLDQLQQSQSELQDARQHVESIVKVMADAVIVTNSLGEVIKSNQAATQLLGYLESDILGKNISEFINSEVALFEMDKSLESGVHGYIKNHKTYIVDQYDKKIPTVLSSSVIYDVDNNIKNIVFVVKDITELKKAEEHLKHLANHDVLTNLPNRLLLLDRLEFIMSRLPWNHRLLAVMFLDLDRFKIINDTLGHDVGDQLLVEVASRLSDSIREGDIVARLGGDEFVILLQDLAHKIDVVKVARKIINKMNKPVFISGQEFVITTSIGISLFPSDGDTPDLLLRNADTAMYRAKENGRNNYMFYSVDMNAEAHKQMTLENDMRYGLERNEFVVYYQPLVSLETGKIVGSEALLRWQHPETGLISPAEFIPLAEENGFIVPLGEYVLSEACQQLKTWHSDGFNNLTISVNIADRQFKYTNLANVVAKVLDETGLDPEYLDLEITEGVLMDQVDRAIEIVKEIKFLGVRFSIDDFGTGYSSLAYLKRFSLDTLKIDRSFIREIPENNEDVAITNAILQMAKALGLKVVAEGIEEPEQIYFLRKQGCEVMQGFYFSKPLPADEMTKLLENDKTLDV